ncbi:subtilisin-like protease SBT3.9 isoform X2 [Coffea arabica]|uniref:Subtilisin-like protease SBT3.9 isoform X2 n=1 Tax=Coffea arabica TaxID=13443 RepID=A0ABM4VV18_COFAR
MLKGLGKHSTSPSNIAVWFLFLSMSISLAAKVAFADSEKKVYIVFMDRPIGQDLRDYAIQILSSVLGSHKAAEEALGYVYRRVGPGFSGRLTPEQATRLQSISRWSSPAML